MIAAGILYGIIITLALQGTFKLVRRIVRNRRAKLIAAVTKSVTMSLGVETQRILTENDRRIARHAERSAEWLASREADDKINAYVANNS